MPRDAYISPFAIGGLNGFCDGQNLFSRLALGRPFDGKLVFYSSLFQAGLDRVVVVKEDLQHTQAERLPEQRLHVVSFSESPILRKALHGYFEHYLGPEWFRNPTHEATMTLDCFLGDLLTSFRLGRPLLTTLPLPDLAPLEVALPLEIISPVQTLFKSAQTYKSVVAIPATTVSKDRLAVVDEIMASAAYKDVEAIQTEITIKPDAAPTYLMQLEKASKALYWHWKDFLRLKSSVIKVAQHIPDIVEALFGKGPSSVSKPVVEILSQALGQNHGLVIYDAHPLLEENLVGLALQLVRSPVPNADEMERRIDELEREKSKRA